MKPKEYTQYYRTQKHRRTSLKFQYRLVDAIKKAKEVFEEGTILDVGFGDKRNLELWGDKDVMGVDINLGLVQEVGSKAVHADTHELPFPDHSYDYVFSSHTLEHCYDPERVAQEFKRVARKGIYLVVPLEKEDTGDPAHYARFPTKEDVLVLFNDWDCQSEVRQTPGEEVLMFAKPK